MIGDDKCIGDLLKLDQAVSDCGNRLELSLIAV